MSSLGLMPVRVGVRFAHAVVQAIADSVGVDVLHIKGPAVDPRLLERIPRTGRGDEVRQDAIERQSLDADVLVRPDHVSQLIDAMCQHSWRLKVDFADGSAFEHAATMGHPVAAPVDVHRRFPGFGDAPERVFQALWRDRQIFDIAGFPCSVPDPTAQRLLLILNAVRGGPARHAEIDHLWTSATPQEREVVERLAVETGAQVALAAATGKLDDYVGYREHDLWKMLSMGETAPMALWRARVRAQPTAKAALREGIKLVVPNSRRLAFQLGRPLNRRELAVAWAERFFEGLRALTGALGRAVGQLKR